MRSMGGSGDQEASYYSLEMRRSALGWRALVGYLTVDAFVGCALAHRFDFASVFRRGLKAQRKAGAPRHTLQ
jgi:hypothetical protein